MDASGLHLIRVSSIWHQRILNAMLNALMQARTQRNTLDSVFREILLARIAPLISSRFLSALV
jgi:hypothetical protein